MTSDLSLVPFEAFCQEFQRRGMVFVLARAVPAEDTPYRVDSIQAVWTKQHVETALGLARALVIRLEMEVTEMFRGESRTTS